MGTSLVTWPTYQTPPDICKTINERQMRILQFYIFKTSTRQLTQEINRFFLFSRYYRQPRRLFALLPPTKETFRVITANQGDFEITTFLNVVRSFLFEVRNKQLFSGDLPSILRENKNIISSQTLLKRASSSNRSWALSNQAFGWVPQPTSRRYFYMWKPIGRGENL